ncbi:MAG: hypothetical protein GY769_18520 [bacterium]|nr:hypothetical protein [bacterium]
MEFLPRGSSLPGYDERSRLRPGVLEENFGLLGSAEKRRAELLYLRSGRNKGSKPYWKEMMAALRKAHQWYAKGYRHNMSQHWHGVQQLSLEAVLKGRIKRPGQWEAALQAAEFDCESKAEFWAFGSLAELWLLAPFAGRSEADEKAAHALEEFVDRVKSRQKSPEDLDSLFPVESTRRQLARYVEWWTVEKGFFSKSSDLAERASALLPILEV